MTDYLMNAINLMVMIQLILAPAHARIGIKFGGFFRPFVACCAKKKIEYLFNEIHRLFSEIRLNLLFIR